MQQLIRYKIDAVQNGCEKQTSPVIDLIPVIPLLIITRALPG